MNFFFIKFVVYAFIYLIKKYIYEKKKLAIFYFFLVC